MWVCVFNLCHFFFVSSNLFLFFHSRHTFCKKCLTQALTPTESSDSTTKCPFDRSPLKNIPEDIGPAPVIISNLANELVAYCPNKSRGCTHTCQRWLLDAHLQQDCLHAKFKCQGTKDDGEQCHEPLEKRFIYNAREISVQDYIDTKGALATQEDSTDTHEKIEKFDISKLTVYCPHEPMDCPNGCGRTFPRYSFEEHSQSECYNTEASCPICNARLLRKDIPQHLKLCPDYVVPCDAADIGCVWVGKRHLYMSEHQRQCKFMAFSPALTKQNKRIDRLEQENRVLRYKLDKVLSSLPENISSTVGFALTSRAGQTSSSTTSTTSTRRTGVRRNSENGSIFDNFRFTDSDLMHMLMEGERLREDVDRLTSLVGDMEMRHGVAIMQESFRTGEEISALRGLVNSLRHQIHFLQSERRSLAFSMQQFQHQQMFHQHQHQPHATTSPVDFSTHSLASSSSSESLLQDSPRRLSG